MTKSLDSLHFRFWTDTQAIDIWTNDFKTFYGILSNFTVEYDEKGNLKSGKFYKNKTSIDNSIARNIYQIFSGYSIFNIPTDEKIKGWEQGLDGDEILIEYSTKTFYSLKEYWTPSVFKAVQEAVTIDKLTKELETTLNMEKCWSIFLNGLPKGCYGSNGNTVTCTKKK